MSDYSGDLERRLMRGLRRGNEGTDYSIPQGAPVGSLEFPKAPEYRFTAPRGPSVTRDFGIQRPDMMIMRSPLQALFGNGSMFAGARGRQGKGKGKGGNGNGAGGGSAPSILDPDSGATWMIAPGAVRKPAPGVPYSRISDRKTINARNLPKVKPFEPKTNPFGLDWNIERAKPTPGTPYSRIKDRKTINAKNLPQSDVSEQAPASPPSPFAVPGMEGRTTGRPANNGVPYSRMKDQKTINASALPGAEPTPATSPQSPEDQVAAKMAKSKKVVDKAISQKAAASKKTGSKKTGGTKSGGNKTAGLNIAPSDIDPRWAGGDLAFGAGGNRIPGQ